MLARNLTGFFVVVFWLATAFWVYKDARRRIDDPWLVGMAALLGLVPPFLGPIVYLFLRPPDSIEERRDRDLENRALEERLAERDLRCPVCRGQVDASFLVCPVCTTRLKQACGSCGSPLEPIWQACPYCADPGAPGSGRRRGVAAALARPPHDLDERTFPRPVRERSDYASAPMATETTLVLVKPDGVRRALCGEIVSRFERRGYELRGARLLKVSRALAQQHYAEHKGKPFFGELVTFITSGPVLALAVRGENAILGVRGMMGATNPADSAPGTIRGDFATLLSENIVHGSDSKASAKRELSLFFPDGLV